MKKLSICVVTLFAVALMAGSVFAASVSTGGTLKIATELIPTDADIQIGAATINGGTLKTNVTWAPSGVIGGKVVFTLTNGKWKGAAGANYRLCKANVAEADYAGFAKTINASDSTTLEFSLGARVLDVASYNIQETADTCLETSAGIKTILINKGNVPGKDITLVVDSVPSDPNATASAVNPIVTLANQFSAGTLTPVTGVLKFGDNKVFNSGKQIDATLVMFSDKLKADEGSLDAMVAVDAVANLADCTAKLGDGALALQLTLTATSGSFQGFVTKDAKGGFSYDGAATLPILEADKTAGFYDAKVTPTLCYSGLAAADQEGKKVSLITNEVDAMVVSAFTTKVDLIAAGTIKSATRNLLAATTSHTIKLDSTQVGIPFLFTSSTADYSSYCVVNNGSALEAGVTLDVLTSEGGAVTGGTALSLGTIPASSSRMVSFTGTSATMDGATGATATVPVLGNTKYSGRLNINATKDDVTINCMQLDPGTTSKRLIPTINP